MLSFLEYINFTNPEYLEEAEANTHSTHIEDLCITDKQRGVGKALSGFRYLCKQFGRPISGKSPAVTIKIDGCVGPDTLVVTKKGPKAVNSLTAKDYVKTVNIANGNIVYEKNSLPRGAEGYKNWVKVGLSNGAFFECTEDHPVLTKDKKYVQARYTVGMLLYSPVDTETNGLTVTSVSCIEKQVQWDLTTKLANFVIKVGENEIVVHNSPAIITGWCGDKFFVASKSLFNKTPKINFSDEDIDTNHGGSGGLADKLHKAFQYLKPVIPKGKIFQGDFLFDTSSRESRKINDVDSYVWQPNTIQYSVEKDSPLGKRIGSAKFGIIFHTEYTIQGEDYTTIKLKGFGVKEQDLNPSKDVWFIDAFHHDLGNIMSLTKEEESAFRTNEQAILSGLSKVDWNFDEATTRNLLTFINSYIRSNTTQTDPEAKAREFQTWIKSKMEYAVNTKKTEKGQNNERAKWFSSVEYAKKDKSLSALFAIHSALTEMKEMLIHKMDSVKTIKTFLVKNNGDLVVTGNEGFVLTRTGAAGCKFVDRYAFSLANFSPEFKKGWDH